MSLGRKLVGSAVIAALIVTSASPALARRPGGWGWNDGGWSGWRHRRDRDDIDGGDVLAGILILGGIAAIAAAASKSRDRDRDRYPDRYPRERGGIDSEDAAVDACAVAAEERATQGGGNASVREIIRVERVNEGWEVEGTVEARRSYRDYGDTRPFRCSVRYGRIENLRLDSNVAWR